MKCTRITDWLETYGDEIPGSEWQDIVLHSKSCPDCGFDLKKRAEIKEAMNGMIDVEIPSSLYRQICENIEMSDAENETPFPLWECLLDACIKPLEIGFSVVCIFMAIILFSTSHSQKLDTKLPPVSEKISQKIIVVPKKIPKEISNSLKSEQQLVKVSDEDVRKFLRKLENYRRLHPEMDAPKKPRVETELAVFSPR